MPSGDLLLPGDPPAPRRKGPRTVPRHLARETAAMKKAKELAELVEFRASVLIDDESIATRKFKRAELGPGMENVNEWAYDELEGLQVERTAVIFIELAQIMATSRISIKDPPDEESEFDGAPEL